MKTFSRSARRLLLPAAALGLLGCGESDIARSGTGTGVVPVPPPAAKCATVMAPAFTPGFAPLPAAPVAVSAEVQAARDRLLGPGATDPAEVKLWWTGVASYIASVGGHLFLFDAWEIVGAHANYSPVSREDLVAIAPEAILVGHGHFDHAGDLGYVAGRSGALVVAGEATCATAREQADRDGNADKVQCLLLGNATEPAIGSVQRLKLWADLPELSVLRHTHSAAEPADIAAGNLPLVFVPDVLTYLMYLNTDPQETLWFMQSLDDETGNSPAGGTWAYHLRVGEFSLLWHDSAGPIAEGKPFAEEITCALDTFPACVDVQLGTIVGFGAVTSGLRDVGLYVRNAHPKVSLPNHHDAWAPVVGPGAESYEVQWRAEVASMPNPPELDYLNDPEDYLRVRSYRIDDPRWVEPMPGSSCAAR